MRLKLLVCTDVAARGLDIKGVTLVVNYDAPSNTEDLSENEGPSGTYQPFNGALSIRER